MRFQRRSLLSVYPRRLGVLALAGIAAMACSDNEATDTLAGPLPSFPSLSVTQQPADLWELDLDGPAGQPLTFSDAWDTATLKRGPTGIQTQLRVTDPVVHAALAGNAITVWVASFHDPNECALEVCQPVDFDNPDVGAALLFAGGRVLGEGPINLAVNVKEGDDSGQILGTATGLVDAETDEIHVVIRTHGPPIPGRVDEQIRTIGGGCDVNDCWNLAVAIFRGELSAF